MSPRLEQQKIREYIALSQRAQEALAMPIRPIRKVESGECIEIDPERFREKHVTFGSRRWREEKIDEFRAQLQQEVNVLRRTCGMPDDIAKRLNTLTMREREQYDYVSGIPLPPTHANETLEDMLNLMLFSRRMVARRMALQHQYHSEMDALMEEWMPGSPPTAPGIQERQRIQADAAEALNRFLKALQRLRKPPEKDEEAEYEEAKKTVMLLPHISGMMFSAIRRNILAQREWIGEILGSQVSSLEGRARDEVIRILKPISQRTERGSLVGDQQQWLAALSENRHVDTQPCIAVRRSMEWEAQQHHFLSRPLSDMLQPLFKKLPVQVRGCQQSSLSLR